MAFRSSDDTEIPSNLLTMKAESTFSSQTPGFEVLDYFKRFQKIVPTFDTPSPWIASRARLTTGVLQTSLPRLAKMRDDIRSIKLRRPQTTMSRPNHAFYRF